MTRSAPAVAIVSCAAIAALAVLLGGGGAAAVGEPTPTATGAAPITVVIPAATSTSTPSATPRPTSTLPTLPFEDPDDPDLPTGACTPGQLNADGSPIPASSPHEDAEELELSEERIAADEWIIATGPGFVAGELGQVVIYRGPVVVGSYTVGADGEFSARFRIPAETSPGTHVIEVTGWQSGCVANAEVTVVTGPSNANWLSLWWVWIVLGALLLGLVSLLVAFRADIARWFARTPAGSAA